MTSKLHGVCDSKGGPLRLRLRRGNAVTSLVLMGCSRMPPVATVIGDQGDDRDKIRKMLAQQGIAPCIPVPLLPQAASP